MADDQELLAAREDAREALTRIESMFASLAARLGSGGEEDLITAADDLIDIADIAISASQAIHDAMPDLVEGDPR